MLNFYLSVPFHKLEDTMEFISREGYTPEVRMTETDYLMSLTARDLDRVRRLLDTKGYRIFTHAPFFGLDVASIDAGISSYSLRCLGRAIEVTAGLGGELMVVHTGYLPQYSREGRRMWFRNWCDRMPRLVERARRHGVLIALENTWDDRPEVLDHLRDLLPDREQVKYCLDTGHMNVYSRLPVRRWWERLGGNVAALHLHDNDGLSDDHLPPGGGTFDFETMVSILDCVRPLPLLDLEVDHERVGEGRRYLVGLFNRIRGAARGPTGT
jgi:sugar phosphate isomerase/epimerase